jgi:hypothetical protein
MSTRWKMLVPAVVLSLGLDTAAVARNRGGRSPKAVCSATAAALFTACKADVVDEAFTAKAKCLNITDDAQREACFNEAGTARSDASDGCKEMRDGRLAACKLLGEGRYDPDLSPALFDDPRNPSRPNPYFPIALNNRWVYRGGDEVDVVEIVDETKLIGGVTCAVARDEVDKAGQVSELTDDWYCPAKTGAVWYFGEETKSFEIFAGDVPLNPELVSIDGSFKAGRDRDKPGIIFLASPKVGDVYLEEFSLGNAEDVTQILSTTYSFGGSADLDQGVPSALAQRMCAGDCVVTKNFSLLEPGDVARKYYARGIGVFLEVESSGFVSQLVDCNFDPRCVGLPQP